MRALAIAALGLACAAPLEARAFVRSHVPGVSSTEPGPCLYWNNRNVTFVTNEQGSKDAGPSTFAAVHASYLPWSAPTCTDLKFTDQGKTARSDVGYNPAATDNLNLVVWRETVCAKVVPAGDDCLKAEVGGCNNKYGCWEQSPATIAVTTTTFSNKTGEIFDADIEFNGPGFVFTTLDSPPCPKNQPVPDPANCVATDIHNTLTHEAGHVIGLDHTDLPDSTMYRSADLGETSKRSLAEDDILGLCTIYPAGKPPLTCVSPNVEGVGNGCCSTAPSAMVAPFLFLLPLALALPRRRRG